jgi:hypothetical protein
VMHLSHRLALYREGRILCEGASADFTPEQVMARLTLHTSPPNDSCVPALADCPRFA